MYVSLRVLSVFLLAMPLSAQILTVPNGGTGANTFPVGQVLIGNGVNALTSQNLANLTVGKATALVSFPMACQSGQFINGFDANGNAQCAQPAGAVGGGITSINSLTAPALTLAAGAGISITPNAPSTITITNTGGGNGTGGAGAGTASATGMVNAVLDCGLIGDGTTNDGPALQACIDANPGKHIFLPKRRAAIVGGSAALSADYYMGTQTITLRNGNGSWLSGEIPTKWLSGTILAWAPNTSGIVVDGTTCVNCRLSDLLLMGPSSQCWQGSNNNAPSTDLGNFGSAHGVVVQASSPILNDLNVRCFNGNGVWIKSRSGQGQPDMWMLHNISVFSNRGNGLLVEGEDSNVGLATGFNGFGNQLWGINENSALGNVYIGPHTNVNGRNTTEQGGINKKVIGAIQRVSNIVTACPRSVPGGYTSANLAANNVISVQGAGTTADFTATPTPITAVSVAANTACPIAGSGLSTGWVQWNQTGPDSTIASGAAVQIGVVSTISSIGRTSNMVTLQMSAPSTTTTPSDIDQAGRWVRITGTGNAELDDHTFRPTVVTPGVGNAVNVQFPLIGPNIATISTGYAFSAGGDWLFNNMVRTVMDASIQSDANCGTNCWLTSATAQFGPQDEGKKVAIKGAGPGGTDLITTIVQFIHSDTVKLANNAAAAPVTNAQLDIWSPFKGGAYQNYTLGAPSVWINPYVELAQSQYPISMNTNAIVIGGNVPFVPDTLPGGTWDTSTGAPTFLTSGNSSVISTRGGMQMFARTNIPASWTWSAGLSQNVDQNFWTQGYQGTNRHLVAKDFANGDFSLMDSQIYQAANTGILDIRNVNTAFPNAVIRIGWGNASPLEYDGRCPGNATPNRVAYWAADTGNYTLSQPCVASASANKNSPLFTLNGYFWNGTPYGASGWGLQNTLSPTSGTPTKSTLRVAPSTAITGGVTGAIHNLSTTMTSLDSYTFAQLTAFKTMGLTVGTEAYCTDCGVATPASCSNTNAAACKCAAGNSGQIATYENLMNGGADWYCASPGVAGTGGQGGPTGFDSLLGGTNTTAAMVVGSGASLTASGGTIAATTAGALAATPGQCTTPGQFATGIAANGNANCSTPGGGPGNITVPGVAGDLLFGGGNNTLQVDSGNATYDSTNKVLNVPAIHLNATTDGYASYVAGTGNLPALAVNSMGFSAPLTGGTAGLIKLPGTLAAGAFTLGAPASVNGVNQSQASVTPVATTATANALVKTNAGGTIDPSFITGSSGNGNVSSAGQPPVHSTAIWQSASTIAGIGPGASGEVFTSNGANADPSWQPAAGGPGGSGNPTFPVTLLNTTTTVQISSTDFQQCRTFAISAGSPTLQLPTTTPPTGQCIWIINWGAGAPLVSRLGTQAINGTVQNINVQTGAPGNTLYPSGFKLISDGTNFVVQRFQNATWTTLLGGTSANQTFTVGNGSTMTTSGTGKIDANRLLTVDLPALPASPGGYLQYNGSAFQWGNPPAGGGGNVSNITTPAAPTIHQMPVWQSATTIKGVGPGNAGDVLTSGGANADPSWQAPAPGGGAGPAPTVVQFTIAGATGVVSGFPITLVQNPTTGMYQINATVTQTAGTDCTTGGSLQGGLLYRDADSNYLWSSLATLLGFVNSNGAVVAVLAATSTITNPRPTTFSAIVNINAAAGTPIQFQLSQSVAASGCTVPTFATYTTRVRITGPF